MKKQRVFQVNTELFKVTGIQKVLIDIHKALNEDYEAKIIGTISYEKIHPNLNIAEIDYLRLLNPFMFRNSIVIIHERRLLPVMWALTHIPWMNVKCVYIHHNELYGKKVLSFFPKNIVAISDAGIKNLTEYFGVPHERITKIWNSVKENHNNINHRKVFNPEKVSILYPARINSVKRQIEIVRYLKGKLDPRIKIMFAGTGPLYNELKELCKDENQFEVLGFREDIPQLMQECDFIMLFSKHEGLSISLIEATQLGVPVICNSVGGNLEIIQDGVNGIIVDEWKELPNVLFSLPLLSQEKIDDMSREGKEIYEKKFKFDIFKKNYLKLIESLE